MRTLVIERNLAIREEEVDFIDWMSSRLWDSVGIGGGHHAFVESHALLEPGVVVVDIGEARRVPLPATIVASEGEHVVSATYGEEELRRLIT